MESLVESECTLNQEVEKKEDVMNFDDFDDFADFQDSSCTQPAFSNLTNNLDNLISNTFEQSLSENFSFEDGQIIKTDLFPNKSTQSYKIWMALQNLEETQSLKLIWKSSHSFQLFLKSLKIESCNALNTNVPVFASGLGLLEPIKSSSTSQTLQPNNNNKNFQAQESHLTSSQIKVSTNIPEVSFDWNSSGLTNPLEENQLNCNLFDFDFFVTNSFDSSSSAPVKMSSLEAELLQEAPLEPLSIISSSSTDPLHQLISQINNSSFSSSSSKKLSSNLSEEANQLLHELPLLSFMRANVLMFPVKEST